MTVEARRQQHNGNASSRVFLIDLHSRIGMIAQPRRDLSNAKKRQPSFSPLLALCTRACLAKTIVQLANSLLRGKAC